jgi:hypothetical protein
MLAIPFTDAPVGIQTNLFIEDGACARDWLAYLQTCSPPSHNRRGALIAAWSEGRPLGQRCDQEKTCLVFLCYGGGSATGSGRSRAGNTGCAGGCAQNRK